MPRRSKQQHEEQLKAIESIIRTAAEPLDVVAIGAQAAELIGEKPRRRTLNRWLEVLVADGRIVRVGGGRQTRYRLAGDHSPVAELPPRALKNAADQEDYIPLSPTGEDVRSLVRRPLGARVPVGYHEAFLRDYAPGKTWYLSEPVRARLHELGRTPEGARPAGTFARQVYERLLIDLAWSSSRLEGNTYSRLDTQNLLERGIRAEGKDAAEAQMILNHKKAIELLVEQAEEIGFNAYTIRNLHAALSENLLDDPMWEGQLRARAVMISETTYVPLAIPQRIEELFGVMLERVSAIPDPFEQAFFMMVQLPYLQPFVDVNKRTSRLAANIPLIKGNLCPLSFVGVPERAYVEGTIGVYEHGKVALLRDVFVWAYERSCQQYKVMRESMGEPDPIRLRYRGELAEVVREVVLSRAAPQELELRRWAAAKGSVDPRDQEAFARVAMTLLTELHEGGIARYGIRPSEFRGWRG